LCFVFVVKVNIIVFIFDVQVVLEKRPSCKYCFVTVEDVCFAFSALTLLVGQQEGHPACKRTEWWGAGVVVYLERGADLHMAQLMPLRLTVSCFSKIQIGFTFLVPAHPGSSRKRAVKRVCVCVCLYNCGKMCIVLDRVICSMLDILLIRWLAK